MNTIHSSSLAFYPTGYTKAGQDSLNKNQAQSNAASEQSAPRQDLLASTPEQIKTALARIGFDKKDNFSQGNNARSNQAVQAYQQTQDQVMQSELENMISRVDTYA